MRKPLAGQVFLPPAGPLFLDRAGARPPLSRPLSTGGAVAQMGERLVRNEEVRGSIPLGSTIRR